MNKCKGCQWYGKPYWSIINPCDNCPRENTNIEIITRWQDPTIKEYKKEIERLTNNWNELEEFVKERIQFWEEQEKEWIKQGFMKFGGEANNKIILQGLLDKMNEIKEGNNEKL